MGLGWSASSLSSVSLSVLNSSTLSQRPPTDLISVFSLPQDPAYPPTISRLPTPSPNSFPSTSPTSSSALSTSSHPSSSRPGAGTPVRLAPSSSAFRSSLAPASSSAAPAAGNGNKDSALVRASQQGGQQQQEKGGVLSKLGELVFGF